MCFDVKSHTLSLSLSLSPLSESAATLTRSEQLDLHIIHIKITLSNFLLLSETSLSRSHSYIFRSKHTHPSTHPLTHTPHHTHPHTHTHTPIGTCNGTPSSVLTLHMSRRFAASKVFESDDSMTSIQTTNRYRA